MQSSLNVINSVVNIPSIKVNYYGSPVVFGYYTDSILYGSSKVYSVTAGVDQVTIVNSKDTLHPIYDRSLKLDPGGVYSLFLSGQAPSLDTLFVKDVIPYRNDSTTGIRFINLSPNSNPLSINITGHTNGSETNNLAYKAITEFKTYQALSSNTTYKFEIRDAVSSTLLSTYTLNTPRFYNVTLVVKGVVGGSGVNALGVLLVKNY